MRELWVDNTIHYKGSGTLSSSKEVKTTSSAPSENYYFIGYYEHDGKTCPPPPYLSQWLTHAHTHSHYTHWVFDQFSSISL